eukprot:COSAG05_NODE_642_length_8135_cov_20.343703_2_plen_101_part_00
MATQRRADWHKADVKIRNKTAMLEKKFEKMDCEELEEHISQLQLRQQQLPDQAIALGIYGAMTMEIQVASKVLNQRYWAEHGHEDGGIAGTGFEGYGFIA